MKTTIAIVDDSRMLRERMIQMLEELGYDVVIEAENGADFLGQLSFASSPPDVCLLDMEMPVMNGCETIAQLRAKWPSIKIMGHSADAANESKMRAAGADSFLTKGASYSELSQYIDALMNRP